MSAFYSFVYPDRVQLLTDGGFFDEEGILRKIGRKVFFSPAYLMAITGRGNASAVLTVIRDMIEFVDHFASYDDVDPVLDVVQTFFHKLKDQGGADIEFLIAAYSKTLGPVHYLVACHEHYDVPAFELNSLGEQIACGPPISLADLSHLNLTAEEIKSPEFPARHGAAIMTAMREKPACVLGTNTKLHAVSGQCDLTTVGRSGVTVRTICRWDGAIGFPVVPSTIQATD